jgi:hypothetical protein
MTGTVTVLIPPDAIERWVGKIKTAWQKSVAAIIETGQVLIEAKAALPHGAFEAMVRLKLPFDASTARRLMMIANHPIISDRAHVHALPSAWGTLYELTKVDDAELAARIDDGTINPKMQRKNVAELRGIERKPTPKPKADKPTVPSGLPVPASFEEVGRSLGIIGMQWLVAARQKIESATVAEIKTIIVTAAALKTCCCGNSDAKREAHKIGLQAMRRGSRLLDKMEKTGERKPARAKKGMRVGTQPGLSLPQLGITRKDSVKWQKVGRLTEKQFQALLNKSERPRRPKAKKIAPPPEQPGIPESLAPAV